MLALTPGRPSHVTSFPSLGGTSRALLRSIRRGECACQIRFGHPAATGNIREETIRSPRFLGSPRRACPALRPRWSRRHQAITVPAILSSAILTASTSTTTRFRGSITRPTPSLSTLRSRGHPRTTQDSLPGGWPALPGRGWLPAGLQRRFQFTIHLHQALPGARIIRASVATHQEVAMRAIPFIGAREETQRVVDPSAAGLTRPLTTPSTSCGDNEGRG